MEIRHGYFWVPLILKVQLLSSLSTALLIQFFIFISGPDLLLLGILSDHCLKFAGGCCRLRLLSIHCKYVFEFPSFVKEQHQHQDQWLHNDNIHTNDKSYSLVNHII